MGKLFDSMSKTLQPEDFGWKTVADATMKNADFLQSLRLKFRELKQEKPLVVYDVDDILHPLEYRIADDLGIDVGRFLHTFAILENPKLSDQEREKIIAAFANSKYFQEIEFIDGIERILEPEKYGARVEINSNAFSEDIGRLKREQLLAVVPGLRPEQIKINVIHYGKSHTKTLNPEMTIFVDDSPFNVGLSQALINIMPTWMPWSYSKEALAQLTDKSVTWRDSLNEMIDFCCQVTQTVLKE